VLVAVRSNDGLGVTVAAAPRTNEVDNEQNPQELGPCGKRCEEPLGNPTQWATRPKEKEDGEHWREQKDKRTARVRERHAGRRAKEAQGNGDSQCPETGAHQLFAPGLELTRGIEIGHDA
jgi:hypothetical protein